MNISLLENVSLLELAIVIAIFVVIFTILIKYFKWAIEAAVILVLVLAGIYLALRVLEISNPSSKIMTLLSQIKEKLGFNDAQTQADVQKLTKDVAETTKFDKFIAKFNLKEIWNDIKALLSF
jgi:apolipoprotein N-acyltransferase